MNYLVEIQDTWGRRVAAYDRVPLIEVRRGNVDEAELIHGMLPASIPAIGPGYRVRVFIEGDLFSQAEVVRTTPQWGDTKKLVIDEYVPLHEVIAFEARRPALDGNTPVACAYTQREIGAMVKDLLNHAPGPLHYWVDHQAYPGGAVREYEKLLSRKTPDNELEYAGVATGQWAGADRIDATAAYAKDGNTIAGLVVDGVPWPDLRLMMIAAEETSLNADALRKHPETAAWDAATYAASAYARKGEAAKALLQQLLDTQGIAFIELNPHRGLTGAFDGRVDESGRYLGLVHGGGECFNAALIELGLAELALPGEGRLLEPECALKDFYSYTGVHTDSVAHPGVLLDAFDATGGVLEAIATLAYAANGYTFSVDAALGLRFRAPLVPDRTVYFDPLRVSVAWGLDRAELVNRIDITGSPLTGRVAAVHARLDSEAEYGEHAHNLEHFALISTVDADRLAGGLLDDLAYPAPSGEIVLHRGEASLCAGDIVEVRGAPVRALATELDARWGGRFAGRMAARITGVRQRLSGRNVTTTVSIGSPLRSVTRPLSFLVRSQPPASALFAFRLDEAGAGLDMGFHLD